ncbi:MAG TPA: hypothetical protein VFH68_20410 [Polyangia bacterium]|nr:hypothetical protein [Polyangia bacterium]
MTGKAAAVQGGLAALGLITAHLTWQREPERAPGDVTLIDAGKNDVGRVHYEDDNNTIELERRKDAGENGVWLHLVEKAKPAHPPDPKAPPESLPPPPPVNPPRDLNGSDVAAKLLDQFAPLRSPRAFGVLDAAKLKELGLEGSKRKLIVNVKGDMREFTVGSPPGPGSGESFLRDTRDGRVYLMPHGIGGDLQAATRLVDRKLHGFEPTDFDRMVLTVGGKSRELVQTHRESPSTAQLASPKTPDKPDQMAKNFHDLIWRSFPMEILGKGEVPKDGQPTPMLRIEYFDGKKSLGYLDLFKTTPGSVQQTDPAGNRTTMYARTERTAGWVKLHVNGQLQSDAEKIVAAQ